MSSSPISFTSASVRGSRPGWRARTHHVTGLRLVRAMLLASLFLISAGPAAHAQEPPQTAGDQTLVVYDPADAAALVSQDAPRTPTVVTIVEPGWVLSNSVSLADPMAAHYNPIDGLLYAGSRLAPGSAGGLYRLNANGSTTKIVAGDRPAGVLVDAADGDIFISEDYGGAMYRSAFGATTRSTWVSGFSSGDDDPVGMAIAPTGYTGPILSAGQALVVDRGANGTSDYIWRWSPAAAEGEVLVHSDSASAGPMVDVVDVAISSSAIYLVDTKETANGVIYRLDAGPTFTPIATQSPIADPYGIEIDPTTGDLLVLDGAPDRLLRVNPATGAVTEIFAGFAGVIWAGVDVAPDGNRIFVTDYTGDKVYTFSRVSQDQFSFDKIALPPRWSVEPDPLTGIPSGSITQRYLLPFYYGSPNPNAPSLTVSISDTLPAVLTSENDMHFPPMSVQQSGQTFTWQTLQPLARNQSGLIDLEARYDNPTPGAVMTNRAVLRAGTHVVADQATTQVPVVAPLIVSPGSGELCAGQVEVRGLVQPGMTVLLSKDNVVVLQVQADATGQFFANYTYDGSATEALTAQACTAGGQCSAISPAKTLRPPQSFWCPQRSSWEGTPAVGPKAGEHLVFNFRNNTGEFSSQNWRIPGVYGFWNTTLHLHACNCPPASGTTAPPSSVWLIADGVRYDPTGSHPNYTFAVTGGAHNVVFWANCGGNFVSSTGIILIDPDGYVFDVTQGFDPQDPTANAIDGVTVTLYELVPEWGGWTPWPAHLYNNQVNPQVTGSDGYFAFFTPPGQYYLQVDGKPGYQPWRSPVITVVNEIVHVNVPYTPWTEPPAVETVTEILLTAGGPQPASVTVPAGATVQWRAEVDGLLPPAELADLAENPVLHPLSALNPISVTLGWDGGMLQPGQIYQRQMNQPGRYAYSDGMGNEGELCVVTCSPLVVTLASFAATPQTGHVQVTWETVSEVNNAGFNLYRSLDGDWASAALLGFVPSQAPGSTQGAAYSWQDFDVAAGQTAWYWLEDVDLGGAVTRHGPVSATMQTPTAVTLAGLEAAAALGSQAQWWLLAALLVLPLALRHRRRA